MQVKMHVFILFLKQWLFINGFVKLKSKLTYVKHVVRLDKNIKLSQ